MKGPVDERRFSQKQCVAAKIVKIGLQDPEWKIRLHSSYSRHLTLTDSLTN